MKACLNIREAANEIPDESQHHQFDSPGADPDQIVLSIEGAEEVEIDPAGDLIISTTVGDIRQPAPRIYQEVNGTRQEIAGRYVFREEELKIHNPQSATVNRMLAFALEDYDTNRALVIDPQILYATYLGGSSTTNLAFEAGQDVAVDAEGSVYLVGDVASADFPTQNPFQGRLRGVSDAFVTKLDANGQLVFSTFFGGSFWDSSTAITVDQTGAVYIAGNTGSCGSRLNKFVVHCFSGQSVKNWLARFLF